MAMLLGLLFAAALAADTPAITIDERLTFQKKLVRVLIDKAKADQAKATADASAQAVQDYVETLKAKCKAIGKELTQEPDGDVTCTEKKAK